MNIRTTARDEAAGQIDDMLAGRSGQGQQLSKKHNPLLFEFERHTTGCGSAPKIGGWKDQKKLNTTSRSGPQSEIRALESGLCDQGLIDDSEPGDSGLGFGT